MEHEKTKLADLDKLRHGKARRPLPLVYVSPYGKRGRNAAKLVDHCRIPDVAGVDDDLGSSERGDSLGPNQSVCIRDDAHNDLAHGDQRRCKSICGAWSHETGMIA